MPSLLDPSDYIEINNALRDVTDTFANVSVTFRHFSPETKNVGVVPRFNESGNNAETDYYDTYTLNAFIEDIAKDQNFDEKGGIQERGIKVLMNFDYLVSQNLVNANTGKFIGDNSRDEIIYKGVTYRIQDIDHIGLLNQKYTVVEIMCQENNYTISQDI